MTRRERLLCVLKRGIPDTVPIYVRGVSPINENMSWMGKHDPSYERLREYVGRNTEIVHGVGLDCGTFLTSAATVGERVISEDDEWRDVESLIETPLGPIRSVTRRSKLNLYEVMEVEFYIKDEKDFDRFMSIPYVPVRPEVRSLMSRKDAEVADCGLVQVGIPSAISLAHTLLGSEALAFWSVMLRDRLDALFAELTRRILEYVEYILGEGAGPILASGGAELAVPPLMSPRDFHDFVTAVDRPVHELIHRHGRHTWIHCHGTIDKVLEEFLEIGVDILEPIEAPPGGDVELADVKRRIGCQVILMGNMPYEAIISWPTETIRRRVKADCEAAMANGGFIMSPCATPFEPELSERGFEGYKAYVEAGREFGKY